MEHSPTRKKWRDTARLNRGVDSPINAVTVPSITELTRGAPHGRPRGRVASLPRGRATMCLLRGPPGLCHVALVPRRNPSRSRAPRHLGPARHVSRRHVTLQVKPLLVIFLMKILNKKNQIKIQKFLKCSEIHISQNTTRFNLKFSPLDHKFLPFKYYAIENIFRKKKSR